MSADHAVPDLEVVSKAPDAQRTDDHQHGDTGPASPRAPLRTTNLLRLQRQAGNRATAALATRRRAAGPVEARTVQRVPVPVEYSETLHQNGAAGATSYVPSDYSIGLNSPSRSAAGETRPSRYQLTRGATSADVAVRIRFIDPIGGRDGVGGALPEGVAGDTRRADAVTICQNLPALWNDKYRFVATATDPVAGVPGDVDGGVDAGVEAGVGEGAGAGPGPAPAGPSQIDLPVRFTATPIFEMSGDADAEVNLHLGQAGPGAPFDAGNYYGLLSNGAPPPNSTYAHEYGHLLGLPDEYNQSNPQAHQILHDAATGAGAPSAGPGMSQRLDDATRRLMVLQSVQAPLTASINGIAGTIATAFGAQRALLSSRLAGVLRSTWREQGTIDSLIATYTPALAGVQGASARLPQVTAFQARDNLSYGTVAHGAVAAALAPASFTALIRAAFTNAIQTATTDAQRITINVSDDQSPVSTPGSETMDVSLETIGVTGTDSALDAAAAQIAQATTGAPAAAPAAGGAGPATAAAPALTPSATLLGALADLPGGWAAVGELFGAEAAALPGLIQTAAAGLVAAPSLRSSSAGALYRYMYRDIAVISRDTALAAVNAFVTRQLMPHLNAQLEQIVAAVQAEPAAHTMVTSDGSTDGSSEPPPHDPAIEAAAATMQERLNTMMASATAGSSHVRYTVNSLMGSDQQGQSIRTEQLDGIKAQFNAQLRHPDIESEFQTRGTGA